MSLFRLCSSEQEQMSVFRGLVQKTNHPTNQPKSVDRAREPWDTRLFNHLPRLEAAWIPSLSEGWFYFYLHSTAECYCTWLCVVLIHLHYELSENNPLVKSCSHYQKSYSGWTLVWLRSKFILWKFKSKLIFAERIRVSLYSGNSEAAVELGL